jgi:hypothetical protein
MPLTTQLVGIVNECAGHGIRGISPPTLFFLRSDLYKTMILFEAIHYHHVQPLGCTRPCVQGTFVVSCRYVGLLYLLSIIKSLQYFPSLSPGFCLFAQAWQMRSSALFFRRYHFHSGILNPSHFLMHQLWTRPKIVLLALVIKTAVLVLLMDGGPSSITLWTSRYVARGAIYYVSLETCAFSCGQGPTELV